MSKINDLVKSAQDEIQLIIDESKNDVKNLAPKDKIKNPNLQVFENTYDQIHSNLDQLSESVKQKGQKLQQAYSKNAVDSSIQKDFQESVEKFAKIAKQANMAKQIVADFSQIPQAKTADQLPAFNTLTESFNKIQQNSLDARISSSANSIQDVTLYNQRTDFAKSYAEKSQTTLGKMGATIGIVSENRQVRRYFENLTNPADVQTKADFTKIDAIREQISNSASLAAANSMEKNPNIAKFHKALYAELKDNLIRGNALNDSKIQVKTNEKTQAISNVSKFAISVVPAGGGIVSAAISTGVALNDKARTQNYKTFANSMTAFVSNNNSQLKDVAALAKADDLLEKVSANIAANYQDKIPSDDIGVNKLAKKTAKLIRSNITEICAPGIQQDQQLIDQTINLVQQKSDKDSILHSPTNDKTVTADDILKNTSNVNLTTQKIPVQTIIKDLKTQTNGVLKEHKMAQILQEVVTKRFKDNKYSVSITDQNWRQHCTGEDVKKMVEFYKNPTKRLQERGGVINNIRSVTTAKLYSAYMHKTFKKQSISPALIDQTIKDCANVNEYQEIQNMKKFQDKSDKWKIFKSHSNISSNKVTPSASPKVTPIDRKNDIGR